MFDTLRRTGALPACLLLLAALCPALAGAQTSLQVVSGSHEFESLQDQVTLSAPQALTLQWSPSQKGAVGGRWQLVDLSAGNLPVASGEAGAAPAPGQFARFNLPATAIPWNLPPGQTATYQLTLQPHGVNGIAIGPVSQAVLLLQKPDTTPPAPVRFGASARFPTVELLAVTPHVGTVQATQLRYAGAEVSLRLHARGLRTDAAWLTVRDASGLMRQSGPAILVPALLTQAEPPDLSAPGDTGNRPQHHEGRAPQAGAPKPAASEDLDITVHLEAVLPPGTSQMPEDQQHTQWLKAYAERCLALRAVLDWRPEPPQTAAQTPLGNHFDGALAYQGFASHAQGATDAPVCQGRNCVSLCRMAKQIEALASPAVGYAYFLGPNPVFGAGGLARTAADGGERPFTVDTRINVASVSKFITALAVLRVMDDRNAAMPGPAVTVDSPIGPYLPSAWAVDGGFRNISFRQLLTHQSGIKRYGDAHLDFDALQQLFTQDVNRTSTAACQASRQPPPADDFNPNDRNYCYSNYNFAILRLILPRLAGLPEDASPATLGRRLAEQYVGLVQQRVFEPVGREGVACRPPAIGGAAYGHVRAGTAPGKDWGDVTEGCGASGWNLSVKDMAAVLLSLNARDGKVLREGPGQHGTDSLLQGSFGLDLSSAQRAEKNGSLREDCDDDGHCANFITTDIMLFQPSAGPRVLAALFANSDITDSQPENSAGATLKLAFSAASWTKP